jgi:pimeloyl-ACP methyl ester carboxylesterase
VGSATQCQPVAYPTDRFLDYDALEALLWKSLPPQDPYVVVAESFSGPLGIRLAADPPPGLAGVMLVATFATSPVRVPAWLARALAPALGAAHPPRAMMARRLLGPVPPPALVDALMSAVRSVDPRVIAARQVAVLEVDVRSAAANAQVPVAYLRAEGDRVVPARCSAELALLHPALELLDLPGPHLLLQREPQAAAERILDFAQRVT